MNKKLIALASVTLASLSFIAEANSVESAKMYLKIDGGYTISTKPTYSSMVGTGANIDAAVTAARAATTLTEDTDANDIKGLKGGNFTAAIGYNLTNSIRMDLAFTYNKLDNKLSTKATKKYYLDGDSMKAMANAYYDFNNSSDLTPFVTVGVGVDSTKFKTKLLSTGTPLATTNADGSTLAISPTTSWDRFVVVSNVTDTSATASSHYNMKTYLTADSEQTGKRKTNFAFQGGLGFAYKMAEGMYLDVAYKFENLSKYDKFNAGEFTQQKVTSGNVAVAYKSYSKTVVSKVWKNSITGGLRVEF